MALTEVVGGSQTATINTEHTLGTDTSGGNRLLGVCLTNLDYGDTVELRIYTKLRAGSTEYVAYMATYAHVQAEVNVYSVPVPANISFKATLKQTSGTGRVFEWAILGM
jgi:hypothetical protein